jgi:glycosyltransferase involved in cell wall biosynthesis
MFPPHAFGGYEMSCADVAQRFAASGWDCTVLTTDLRIEGVDGETVEGVLVDRGLEFYWDDHRLLRPGWRGAAALERRNHARLQAVLESSQPDVISIWNMGAMSFGLLNRLASTAIPLVFCVCDDWLVYGPDLDGWLRRLHRRKVLARLAETLTGIPSRLPDLGRAGTFCFVSNSTRQRAEAGSRWTFPDATVVYSGIDPVDFPLSPLTVRPWKWRVLYVGRLDPRKGIDSAIRALALLPPEATLDVVGRGDARERERLEALSLELGVAAQVRFAEVVRNELRAIYEEADALVFPSVWAEPFGLTPVEAMACATPVVAARVGGAAEFLVDGENCLEFMPGSPEAAAAAILRLADSADLRSRLVAGGLRTAAELSVDRLAETLDAWHRAAAVRFAEGRPLPRRLAHARDGST